MKRPTRRVQVDTCDSCNGMVLTTNWDDLEAVFVDYVVDPTPVDRDQQIACLIAGRRMFYLEQTIVRTFRLSVRHADNIARNLPFVVSVLPAHQCGNRHDSVMPADIVLALTNVTAPLPETPVWAAA